MSNIRIGRYSDPEAVGGWQGWIEPEDKSWIIFVDIEGHVFLFPERDENGGVIESGEDQG